MDQKYKFFIRERTVTVQANLPDSVDSGDDSEADDSITIESLSAIFDACNLAEDKTFHVTDLDYVIEQLMLRFKWIEAAGGFVTNPKNELLVIYRLGFWDLPKGKIENGESVESAALREVEEECGITGLTIESRPYCTYHLYPLKGKTVIKKTYWFKMSSNWTGILIPQQEEGIEQVCWTLMPLTDERLAKMYRSIQSVINYFS